MLFIFRVFSLRVHSAEVVLVPRCGELGAVGLQKTEHPKGGIWCGLAAFFGRAPGGVAMDEKCRSRLASVDFHAPLGREVGPLFERIETGLQITV